MKKLILSILFLVAMTSLVSAKTIEPTLYEKNNIEVPGYNITLLLIGSNEKSIVVCVNNEKRIVNKDSQLILKNLKIEPARIYNNNVRLKITYSCEKCVCDESCSNTLCFPQETQEKKNESIQENAQQINQQEQIKEEKDNTTLISIILFFIVLILLITLLIKKKR